MNGKKIMTTIGILALIGLGYFKGLGIYSESKTPSIGLTQNNELIQCGNKPNCVSSFNTDEEHKVNFITTTKTISEIVEVFKSQGLALENQTENYAHFTYKSAIMGYVDDIEILQVADILHIKSSSRVGHSDLGANLKRVEMLRTKLLK